MLRRTALLAAVAAFALGATTHSKSASAGQLLSAQATPMIGISDSVNGTVPFDVRRTMEGDTLVVYVVPR